MCNFLHFFIYPILKLGLNSEYILMQINQIVRGHGPRAQVF